MKNSNTNFEANKTYKFNFIGDSELWVFAEVVKRTAKTIWIKCKGEDVKACRVDTYQGEEYIFPLGKYSMAPTLKASRLVK